MLSDEPIHLATLVVLGGNGIQINLPQALELLDGAGAGDVYEMALLIVGSQEQLQQAPSMLGTTSSPSRPRHNPEPLLPETVLGLDRMANHWK